jgi:thiamine biosynthesis lipoprotein
LRSGLVFAALLVVAPGRAGAAELTFRAFGLPGEAAALGLPRPAAEAALDAAVAEILALETLTDPNGNVEGGVGRLNAAAGSGPVPVEGRLAELLDRALAFCRWSEGVAGPLGGRLQRLWTRGPREAPEPEPAELAPAAESAACDRLRRDRERGTAELARDSSVDLLDFAPGLALDRAIEVLRRQGAGNARLRLGGIHRAIGAGPAGGGWPVAPPAVPGFAPPLEAVWLRDQALAAAARSDSRRYLDLSRGRPTEGVLVVLAATELAVDAQGLAATLFATGSRRGQLRLGGLTPRPSVLWVLGSGEGAPLLVDYRWSELRRAAAGGSKSTPR